MQFHSPALDRPAQPLALPSSSKQLLDIDANLFRAKFGQQPFVIGHRLAEHPLFDIGRILELSRKLPEKFVEYNAGNLPVSVRPELTPRNGLSPEETIQRISECKSWMVLKYVETDPDYRELLESCLAEIRPHSEPLRPGMCLPEGFIFLTSPGSVTPYHMDPEHNFLLQIRGKKKVHQFDGHDPNVLSQEELERFYLGAHRNLEFKESYRAKEWVFELAPGQGLHFPVTFPHYVENLDNVSISFSITFRTPDLDKRTMVFNVNAYLRNKGLKPTPVGKSPLKDRVKYQAGRLVRKTRKLFGRAGW